MIYDTTEILALVEGAIIVLFVVGLILNREVLTLAKRLVKSVAKGDMMAVDKAIAFVDADGDGDVDMDDVKFIMQSVNIPDLKKAIKATHKHQEYARDNIPYAPKIAPGQMFVDAVSQKSEEA